MLLLMNYTNNYLLKSVVESIAGGSIGIRNTTKQRFFGTWSFDTSIPLQVRLKPFYDTLNATAGSISASQAASLWDSSLVNSFNNASTGIGLWIDAITNVTSRSLLQNSFGLDGNQT